MTSMPVSLSLIFLPVKFHVNDAIKGQTFVLEVNLLTGSTILPQVTDKLQKLNDEFEAMNSKKNDLEKNIELCSQKLVRAEKLIRYFLFCCFSPILCYGMLR